MALQRMRIRESMSPPNSVANLVICDCGQHGACSKVICTHQSTFSEELSRISCQQ